MAGGKDVLGGSLTHEARKANVYMGFGVFLFSRVHPGGLEM